MSYDLLKNIKIAGCPGTYSTTGVIDFTKYGDKYHIVHNDQNKAIYAVVKLPNKVLIYGTNLYEMESKLRFGKKYITVKKILNKEGELI